MVAGRAGRRADPARSAAGETFTLLRRYVVQETFGPLRHVLRTLAFGVSGALLLGVGCVVLLLAELRALQTETGSTFAGSWTFAPYLLSGVTALLLAALGTLLGLRGMRRSRHTEGSKA
jgi:hypothetical protein